MMLLAYGQAFRRRVRAMGIRDRPMSPRSPWQNPDAPKLKSWAKKPESHRQIIFCPKVLDDLRDALNAISVGNVLALGRNAIHSPAAALRRPHRYIHSVRTNRVQLDLT